MTFGIKICLNYLHVTVNLKYTRFRLDGLFPYYCPYVINVAFASSEDLYEISIHLCRNHICVQSLCDLCGVIEVATHHLLSF